MERCVSKLKVRRTARSQQKLPGNKKQMLPRVSRRYKFYQHRSEERPPLCRELGRWSGEGCINTRIQVDPQNLRKKADAMAGTYKPNTGDVVDGRPLSLPG